MFKWLFLAGILAFSGCKTVEVVLVAKYQDGPLSISVESR